MKRIHSSDRCPHCGHWAGDDEKPFVIFSASRAKWLISAAKQLAVAEGDDTWVDWVDEGNRLSRWGE